MRWAILSSAPLWLSGLGPGLASGPTKETIIVRQEPSGLGSFVYRGDERSPQEIREAGGFQPQGDGWDGQESSYSLHRHFEAGPNGRELDESCEPGFVFRTAYVSMAMERSTAESYGDWLYEIRALPNILNDGHDETEVMALGGVHWRQVRRFVQMGDLDSDSNRVDEAAWIDNPEYDAETYQGRDAARCQVSTIFPNVLRGSDSDDIKSSNDRHEEDDSASEAARSYMGTQGVVDLFGTFPPVFRQYQPNKDIPGPDHPPPESVDEEGKSLSLGEEIKHSILTVANQVTRQLQHYIDMGSQRLEKMFPGGAQMFRELFDQGANEGACAAAEARDKSTSTRILLAEAVLRL